MKLLKVVLAALVLVPILLELDTRLRWHRFWKDLDDSRQGYLASGRAQEEDW